MAIPKWPRPISRASPCRGGEMHHEPPESVGNSGFVRENAHGICFK